MIVQDAPRAIDPRGVPRCLPRCRRENLRSASPVASDKLAPMRRAKRPAARQRRRRDAEIVFGGEVSWLCLIASGTINANKDCGTVAAFSIAGKFYFSILVLVFS